MATEEEAEAIIPEVEVDTIVEVTDLSGIEGIPEVLEGAVHVLEVQNEDQSLPRGLAADLADHIDLPDLQGPLRLGRLLHTANHLSLPKGVDHQKSKQRKLREQLCKTAH